MGRFELRCVDILVCALEYSGVIFKKIRVYFIWLYQVSVVALRILSSLWHLGLAESLGAAFECS